MLCLYCCTEGVRCIAMSYHVRLKAAVHGHIIPCAHAAALDSKLYACVLGIHRLSLFAVSGEGGVAVFDAHTGEAPGRNAAQWVVPKQASEAIALAILDSTGAPPPPPLASVRLLWASNSTEATPESPLHDSRLAGVVLSFEKQFLLRSCYPAYQPLTTFMPVKSSSCVNWV